MSNKRKGQTAPSPQWAKHLRPYWKSVFWSRQRADDKALCEEGDEIPPPPKAKRKKVKKKKWGIQWGSKHWKDWYETEQARDKAFECRKHGWMVQLFGVPTKVER